MEKRPLLISDKRAGTIRVKGIKQSESGREVAGLDLRNSTSADILNISTT